MNSRQAIGFWFLLSLTVLAFATSLEVYIVLVLIALLIGYQMLLDHQPELQRRVGLFLLLGGAAFVFIVVERVRDVL